MMSSMRLLLIVMLSTSAVYAELSPDEEDYILRKILDNYGRREANKRGGQVMDFSTGRPRDISSL